jgi:LysM repeat protein
LSDGNTKAKPDSLLKPYEICDNDIIMLCTDGLSGMIRDNEIESVMRHNERNMDTLVDELIKAACEAEGSDNITICLCQILQGGCSSNPAVLIDYDNRINGAHTHIINTLKNKHNEIASKKKHIGIIVMLCVIITILGSVIWWGSCRKNLSENNASDAQSMQLHKEGSTHDEAKANQVTETNQIVNAIEEPIKENKANATRRTSDTLSQKSSVNEKADKDTNEIEDNTELTPLPTSDKHDVSTADQPQESNLQYKVLKGDSYYSIAKKFNVKVETLKSLNNNVELKAGATINIPK